MNLFNLAELELQREGREPTESLILSRAVTIRKWLDKGRGALAVKILAGGKVYQYKSRVIVR